MLSVQIALLILLVCVAVWFALVAHLFRLLRTREPDVYDSLGRPTLILNNTRENSLAFLRFLVREQFHDIDDAEIVSLCRFMRTLFIGYVVLFVVLVIFVVAPGVSNI